MSRLLVGVASVAAIIGVAGSAHAQVTPGPRRPPPSPPSDPSDTWDKHTSIGLELGPGGVLTSYDANESPSALLFYGAVRGSYDITPMWSGGLTLRQWWLPGSNHATMFGLTARFEPKVYDWGRTFVDAAVGATTTSFAWAFGFDVGAGIEWTIPDAPGLGIGPYVRYNQVINPDDRVNADGRAWSVAGWAFDAALREIADALPDDPGAAALATWLLNQQRDVVVIGMSYVDLREGTGYGCASCRASFRSTVCACISSRRAAGRSCCCSMGFRSSRGHGGIRSAGWRRAAIAWSRRISEGMG